MFRISSLSIALLLIIRVSWAQPSGAGELTRTDILSSMKLAAAFMVEKVSYKGGYVWSYLPDMSRRWGEMEAKETMIWVQPPGTATVGHLYLDAYHLTGDRFYYEAAKKAAYALVAGQHPSGGWNYMIDFGGEASLREWYETIGANGWRLEEFHHYYGNATFDDGGTQESAMLLLRMHLEEKDQVIKEALFRAIRFVLDSQYPNGGWPQRYPPAGQFSKDGLPDYISFITFNDDVAQGNIEFLITCYQALRDPALLQPIYRAMDAFLLAQAPAPQAGWAMQYTPDMKPAGARTYEPVALSTSTTANNIGQLMNFYRLTGDRKYLARIPEALSWLESVSLPDSLAEANATHPTFVEIGTGKFLFLHRKGSNAMNGRYYADYNPENTIAHYRSTRYIDVQRLRKEYNDLFRKSPEEASRPSPLLKAPDGKIPAYFSFRYRKISDLNSRDIPYREVSAQQVKKTIEELDENGRWIVDLNVTTNPYIGPAPDEARNEDYGASWVGDKYDTSPYASGKSQPGISTGVFVRNMSLLMEYLLAR